MRTIALALIIALRALSSTADEPVGFATVFHDQTMRVDLVHVGNASEEFVTLDRVLVQGAWAGSRTHMVDPFGIGRYEARLVDPATGAVLFSRGFDSYFGEYRTTDAAAKGVRRAYHESVLTPLPKKTVRFVLLARTASHAAREIASFDIDPASWTLDRSPLDPAIKVYPAHISGDPHGKVDVAIIGEGYTVAEEGKFRADLDRFTKIFLNAEPYAHLRDRFNIRGVLKFSQQSGCSEPSFGAWRTTTVGASFDSLGSERYVLTEDNRALRNIATAAPYDALYIMVNSPRYGGGGIYNLFCTFTTDNQWAEYIFLHEFGHTFGGLADEYYTSSVAYNDFYPKGIEPAEANITALLDPTNVKWKALVTPGTAVPTPWEKAGFDTMDLAYQETRGELNEKIAKAKRDGTPKDEVAKLQEDSERLSREHAAKIDSYLATSRFAGRVGAFEGAGYAAQGLYRPMLDCLMFSKGAKPFCRVCQAHLERVIEQYSE